MAEENKAQEQEFHVLRVYTKDVSFESPRAPQVFLREQNWAPDVGVQLNTESQHLSDGVYETVLTLTVTAKLDNETAYLVEIKQAGIFQIKGLEGDALGGLLGAYCPNVLFPFAREAVCNLVTRGGFPQLLLDPINFDALYQQHLQQQAQGDEAGGEAAPQVTQH